MYIPENLNAIQQQQKQKAVIEKTIISFDFLFHHHRYFFFTVNYTIGKLGSKCRYKIDWCPK